MRENLLKSRKTVARYGFPFHPLYDLLALRLSLRLTNKMKENLSTHIA